VNSPTEINRTRIRLDLIRSQQERYYEYWKSQHRTIPEEVFDSKKQIFLEIGAGSGSFFLELARRHPEVFFLAIERDRMRAKSLLKRTKRAGFSHMASYRGNIIPNVVHGIPDESVDRIYLLYPCPWTKTSSRRNRWYLHPIMPHMVRVLKKNGLMLWTSDQKFYIDEARYVCEHHFNMTPLVHGPLTPNGYNDLEHFPRGRTKFEQSFMTENIPSFELVAQKTSSEYSKGSTLSTGQPMDSPKNAKLFLGKPYLE